MGAALELQQLRYFLAVAEAGSFTAAAARCRVAQPSLSVQLAKLEAELGGPLFERSRQGARLTARGQRFRGRAAEALRQLEAGRSEAAEAAAGAGSVRLGCMPTTGAYLLPPLLQAFARARPGAGLDLREESSPTLAGLLKEGEVELAILDEAGLAPGLERELLFSEPLLLALPPGHALAGKRRVPLGALAGEPLILMKPGHGFRKIVLDCLARAGVEPRVVHESGEIATVQALVGAGLGLALVPRMVRQGGGPAYAELAEPRPSRSLFLAWRQGAALSPAGLALREAARRSLRRA